MLHPFNFYMEDACVLYCRNSGVPCYLLGDAFNLFIILTSLVCMYRV